MAEKNREEASQFRDEDKAFLAALNEQVGKINEALDGFDQAARAAIQLYLDSDGIESRRRAFATIKQLFNGDVGLGGHAPADWIRNDFRIWLSQLGFNFAVSNGAMGICSIPDDRTLAWRLTRVPKVYAAGDLDEDEAEARGIESHVIDVRPSWFCEDPYALQQVVESLDSKKPEKALQIEDTKRFLDDVRRVIELEEDPEVRRPMRRLAEDLERQIEELQDESGRSEREGR